MIGRCISYWTRLFLGDQFIRFRGIYLPFGTSQGEGSASEGDRGPMFRSSLWGVEVVFGDLYSCNRDRVDEEDCIFLTVAFCPDLWICVNVARDQVEVTVSFSCKCFLLPQGRLESCKKLVQIRAHCLIQTTTIRKTNKYPWKVVVERQSNPFATRHHFSGFGRRFFGCTQPMLSMFLEGSLF